MKMVQAPCSSCVRKTSHEVLFEASQQDEDYLDNYVLLKCGGCSTISMGHQSRWLSDGSIEHKYYPSPVSRKEPNWVGEGNRKERELGALLRETYQAVDGGQNRLAAMGIRALLEQVMILKVGDLSTFNKKLDEFRDKGFISKIQRDAMRSTLNVGDAAMHRGYKPTAQELEVALDIVEGIFAPIFGHKEAAEKLADRVPPRAPRTPKK